MNERPVRDYGALLDKRLAFGTLGDVKVFSAQKGRTALLLVAMLLACHGVFGVFHLFSGTLDATSLSWSHGGTPLVGERPSHAGAAVGGHGAEESTGGGYPSTSEYAAVLLAVFVGTVLGLLLGARVPLPFSEARLEAGGFMLSPGVPALARGPDLRAFLQIFRL